MFLFCHYKHDIQIITALRKDNYEVLMVHTSKIVQKLRISAKVNVRFSIELGDDDNY